MFQVSQDVQAISIPTYHGLIQGSGQWLCRYGRFIAHTADLGICCEAPEKRHASTGATVEICEYGCSYVVFHGCLFY